MINRKPIRSVANPGIINRTAANAIAAPEINYLRHSRSQSVNPFVSGIVNSYNRSKKYQEYGAESSYLRPDLYKKVNLYNWD